LFEFRKRFLGASEPRQRHTHAAPCLAKALVLEDGILVFRQRFQRPIEGDQRVAPACLQYLVVRKNTLGALEVRGGLGVASRVELREAKRHPLMKSVGHARDRRASRLERFVDATRARQVICKADLEPVVILAELARSLERRHGLVVTMQSGEDEAELHVRMRIARLYAHGALRALQRLRPTGKEAVSGGA